MNILTRRHTYTYTRIYLCIHSYSRIQRSESFTLVLGLVIRPSYDARNFTKRRTKIKCQSRNRWNGNKNCCMKFKNSRYCLFQKGKKNSSNTICHCNYKKLQRREGKQQQSNASNVLFSLTLFSFRFSLFLKNILTVPIPSLCRVSLPRLEVKLWIFKMLGITFCRFASLAGWSWKSSFLCLWNLSYLKIFASFVICIYIMPELFDKILTFIVLFVRPRVCWSSCGLPSALFLLLSI